MTLCEAAPFAEIAGVILGIDGLPQFTIDHYADPSKAVRGFLGNAPGQVYSDPHYINPDQTSWWAVSDSAAGDGTGIWYTTLQFASKDLVIPPAGLKLYYYGYYHTDYSGGTMYSTGATHLKVISSPVPLTIEQVHTGWVTCGSFQTLCAGSFIIRTA